MSELTLVIGNKNYSSWSLRPWIFMKEHKIQFEEKRVPLFTPNTHSQLLPYGSDGKVPVLIDGDVTLWDSLAILEYVSEKYLNGRGWPKDESARAMARSVSAEMHSSFFEIRNHLPMNCKKVGHPISISANTKKEILRIEHIWEACLSRYGKGQNGLFGEYSIADAMFAPIAIRFHGYGIQLGEVATAYVDAVLAQDNIKSWIEDGKNEKEVIEEAEV